MRFLIIFLSCIISLSSFSQHYTTKKKSAISRYEEGLKAYRMMNFDYAKVMLRQAIEKDEQFLEPNLLMAEIYMELQEFDTALIYYNKILHLNPNYKPLLFMNVAEVQLHLAEYEDAKINLAKFVEKYEGVPEPLQPKYNLLKATADFGANALKNPVPFEPINLGKNVNNQFDVYHPSITVDGNMIVYTRKEPVGRTGNGKLVFKEDLYYSKKEGDQWGRAVNFREPINTLNFNEGSSSISHDGKLLFFTACNREGGYGSCDIYMSKVEGVRWSSPQNMGKVINTSAWESHPSLSPDGRTLYFTSNRKGGKGGADIWSSTLDSNGKWQKAVNLSINTSHSDMTPYIHADGKTFYFSSQGYPGMGAHDIFYTRIDEEGAFTKPQNLGYPINSSLDEFGMIADPEGRMAYYASEMKGGNGKLDLYKFELPSDARAIPTQSIHGMVYDRDTKRKLVGKVELLDLQTGKLVASTNSDKFSGRFLVALPSERDYALNVSRDGYLFYSENFSLKGKQAEEVELLVPLVPIKVGEKVVLKNVFFETSKFDLRKESEVELNKLVTMLLNSPGLKIEIGGHTDNVGDAQKNRVLSENRANAVKGYLVSKGITPDRLMAKGYGSSNPIADNSTEEGRAQNRRTEFKVVE